MKYKASWANHLPIFIEDSTNLLNSNGYDTKEERVASLLTPEDAKAVAEQDFNKKVEKFLESINDK